MPKCRFRQPLLKEHEGRIDDGLSELSSKIKSQAAGVTSQIAERARRATADSLLTVSSALITGEDPAAADAAKVETKEETKEKVKKVSGRRKQQCTLLLSIFTLTGPISLSRHACACLLS